MSTTTATVLVFANGLDGLWAIYVLLAVLGSALVFLKAYHYGSDYFQDELRI